MHIGDEPIKDKIYQEWWGSREPRNRGIFVYVQISEVAAQMDRLAKKAYGMLAFICHSTKYNSKDLLVQLYKTLIRLLLELCVQSWLLHNRNNMIALGRVRRTLPGTEYFIYLG